MRPALRFLTPVLALAAVAAAAAGPDYDSAGTRHSANLLRDSFEARHHGRFTEAINKATEAIAESPDYGNAYIVRGEAYVAAGRYGEAVADFDRAASMHPDDFRIPLHKVEIDLYRGQPQAALDLINVIVQMPVYTAAHNPHESRHGSGGASRHKANGHAETHILALSSIAEQMLHQDDAAIDDMTIMVQHEQQNPEHIMSFYCWNAAVAGLLQSAEMTCQKAIDANNHDIGQYDSLGYVYLRLKQWDKAISAYDRAIEDRPDMTTALYGRGIAKKARGDISGGNADLAAATRGEPDIANIMQRLHAPAS